MSSTQGKFGELRKKIIATFLLLVVFRLTSQVPVPGVDAEALKAFFNQSSGTVFDMLKWRLM